VIVQRRLLLAMEDGMGLRLLHRGREAATRTPQQNGCQDRRNRDPAEPVCAH
jgi:hypothetical protein